MTQSHDEAKCSGRKLITDVAPQDALRFTLISGPWWRHQSFAVTKRDAPLLETLHPFVVALAAGKKLDVVHMSPSAIDQLLDIDIAGQRDISSVGEDSEGARIIIEDGDSLSATGWCEKAKEECDDCKSFHQRLTSKVVQTGLSRRFSGLFAASFAMARQIFIGGRNAPFNTRIFEASAFHEVVPFDDRAQLAAGPGSYGGRNKFRHRLVRIV